MKNLSSPKPRIVGVREKYDLALIYQEYLQWPKEGSKIHSLFIVAVVVCLAKMAGSPIWQ